MMLLSQVLIMALAETGGMLPRPEHGLDFDTPAMRWDEAMPLGNGLLGALVWGNGNPLRISLDRTDLWDLRPVEEFETEDYDWGVMQAWEREGRYDDLKRLYEDPYHRPAPTKIPAGRIEIRFDKSPAFAGATLTLADATAAFRLADKTVARVWIHATEPVGVIEITGKAGVQPRLAAPAFGGKEAGPVRPAIVAGELAQLGYPPPTERGGEQWTAYEQEGWGGFRFAVHLGWRASKGRWLGAWSVASSFEGPDPAAIAAARVARALDGGLEALRESHEAWWRQYWEKSSISVPNPVVERQWYLDTYKFGAASRRGSPPITLQGPWTADDGKLPPWKGDYHHDLNTQLSYWPCYSGNRLEEGLSFLDWLWNTRENCIAWTGRFYKLPGMNVPMTADLHNRQIGGWRQYTHSATTAAWLAHHFYLHWKYSADPEFLETRAYPYLRDCAVFLEAVTETRDAAGKRSLPLSSSPEIHDNKPDAWFSTITNYDLALIRWLFGAAAEMADELKQEDEAARWRRALSEMPDFALGEDKRLLVAAGHPLHESHRHFSHLMAVHPLGLIDRAMGPEAEAIVRATYADLERLGTDYWTGYSFAWQASVAARARNGEAAARALEIFATAFTLRSSFHCNGDQSGKGYSKFIYRPFTLEGNFAAAAGTQEMLLQSHAGIIEVFPAIPADWKNAGFRNLRAQGAFLVSAERREGVTRHVEILAERGGPCRLRCPFTGQVLEFHMQPGERKVIAQNAE